MDTTKVHAIRLSELPPEHDKQAWEQVRLDLERACADLSCTILVDFEAVTIKSSSDWMQRILQRTNGLAAILAGVASGLPPSTFLLPAASPAEWEKYYTGPYPSTIANKFLLASLAAQGISVPKPKRIAMRGLASFQGSNMRQAKVLDIIRDLSSIVQPPDSDAPVVFKEHSAKNGFLSEVEVLDLRCQLVRARTVQELGDRYNYFNRGEDGQILGPEDVGPPLREVMPRLRLLDVGGSIGATDFMGGAEKGVNHVGSRSNGRPFAGGLLRRVILPSNRLLGLVRALGLDVEQPGTLRPVSTVPVLESLLCPSHWRLYGPIADGPRKGAYSGVPPMDLSFAGLGGPPQWQDDNWAATVRKRFPDKTVPIVGSRAAKMFSKGDLLSCSDLPSELRPHFAMMLQKVLKTFSSGPLNVMVPSSMTDYSYGGVEMYALGEKADVSECDGVFNSILEGASGHSLEAERLSGLRITSTSIASQSLSMKLHLARVKRIDLSDNAGLCMPSLMHMSGIYGSIYSMAGMPLYAYVRQQAESKCKINEANAMLKYKNEASSNVRERQELKARRELSELRYSSYGWMMSTMDDDEYERKCEAINDEAERVSPASVRAEAISIAKKRMSKSLSQYADLMTRKVARAIADWYCQYTGELSECVFPVYGLLSCMKEVVQLDLGGVVLEPFVLPALVAGLRNAKTLRSLNLSGCFSHIHARPAGKELAARCLLFVAKHVPHVREIGLGGHHDKALLVVATELFSKAGGLEGTDWLSADELHPQPLKKAPKDGPGTHENDSIKSSDGSQLLDVSGFLDVHKKFDIDRLPELPSYGSATWLRSVRDACHAKRELVTVANDRAGIRGLGMQSLSARQAHRAQQKLPAEVPVNVNAAGKHSAWRPKKAGAGPAEQAVAGSGDAAAKAHAAAAASAARRVQQAEKQDDQQDDGGEEKPSKRRRVKGGTSASVSRSKSKQQEKASSGSDKASRAGPRAGSKRKRRGNAEAEHGDDAGALSPKGKVIELDSDTDEDDDAEGAAATGQGKREVTGAGESAGAGSSKAAGVEDSAGSDTVIAVSEAEDGGALALVVAKGYVPWTAWNEGESDKAVASAASGASSGADDVVLAPQDIVPPGNFTGPRRRLRIVVRGSMWRGTGFLGDKLPEPDSQTDRTPSQFAAPPVKLNLWEGRVKDLSQRLQDEHAVGSVGTEAPKPEALELVLGCFVPEDGAEEAEEGSDGSDGQVAMDAEEGGGKAAASSSSSSSSSSPSSSSSSSAASSSSSAASGAGADEAPKPAAGPGAQPLVSCQFTDVFTMQAASVRQDIRDLSLEDVTLAVDTLRDRKVVELAEGGARLCLMRPDALLDADSL